MSNFVELALPRYEEVVGTPIINAPNRPLTKGEVDLLWSLVERIEDVWFLQHRATSIKPQWLDYLQASIVDPASLLGEYENAMSVYSEIFTSSPAKVSELLVLRPAPALSATSTRLDHAKLFVIDRFIKCYVMLVGFQEFGGRNYNGYMASSRFSETISVRVGKRQ